MKEIYEKYLNHKATIQIERPRGLKIEVIIKDIKNSYGRTRFLVSPTTGLGQVWVEKLKLKK